MASEATHTPGPWTAPAEMIREQGVAFAPVAANTLIAKVYSTAYQDDPQALANARLMAAAPELKDALKAMADAYVALLLMKAEDPSRFQEPGSPYAIAKDLLKQLAR